MGYVCPWENESLPAPVTVFRVAAGRCQLTSARGPFCNGLVCSACGRCQHCQRQPGGRYTAPVRHVAVRRPTGLYLDGQLVP